MTLRRYGVQDGSNKENVISLCLRKKYGIMKNEHAQYIAHENGGKHDRYRKKH